MQSPEVQRESLIHRIYNINEQDIEGVAVDVWKYQYQNNSLYNSFCNLLGIREDRVSEIKDIPFIPILMFREHEIKTGFWEANTIFRSSGTTGSKRSNHFIRDLSWYDQIAVQCFTKNFGNPSRYVWLGLLPSYLDRSDSSLVHMVHHFMKLSGLPENSFYPDLNTEIISALQKLSEKNQPTMLMGVSFALLDLFEKFEVPVWENLTIIETGGMKGRGQEITRDELYTRLRYRNNNLVIASEYGMTELLSQAYRIKEFFQPGPAMKVLIRDISDPLSIIGCGQRGVINILDLANIDTCSFIATDDIGKVYEDGSFDVLGRMDNSDLRGCNLMYSSM